MKKLLIPVTIAVILMVVGALLVRAYIEWWHSNYYTVERNEYNEPEQADELKLSDDLLVDKNPEFDANMFDPRPIGDWAVNLSAAVTQLECMAVKPDVESEMLVLRPSYAEAMKAAGDAGQTLLPSVNLLDGAAKQFDDGVYAAVDLAIFQDGLGHMPSAVSLIGDIFKKLPRDNAARPFLAAALQLAETKVTLTSVEAKRRDKLSAEFQGNRVLSKPIAFYNWTPELQQVWRFFRFLQTQFHRDDLSVPRAIATVLKADRELLQQYRTINAFYGKLTNPSICLPVDALIDTSNSAAVTSKELGVRGVVIAVFPPSTSRETELFNKIFPAGAPAGANLISVLIRRIRSGDVNLAPDDRAGWYQYQVYALQAMLLPGQVQESEKLLLTAAYKKRLIDAFKAFITKRRETHSRQTLLVGSLSLSPLGRGAVRPRLRIEPSVTFYLRTARAYGFLQNVLLASVGHERLAAMHGLCEGGRREMKLAEELEAIKQRFYGFYLVACEDIGMRPKFLKDELVNRETAKQIALTWLESLAGNSDLACDTRVAAPIYVDLDSRKTRLWGVLGVRLAHLRASYARGPKIRPKDQSGDWRDVESDLLGDANYVIPIDAFGEFEINGMDVLTREEFRKICDRHETKERIIEALSTRGP
jgi:hypothetical protein